MTAHNINKPMCACRFAAVPHNVLISQAALRATLTFEKLLIHDGGEAAVSRPQESEAGSSKELLAFDGNSDPARPLWKAGGETLAVSDAHAHVASGHAKTQVSVVEEEREDPRR